MATHTGLPLRSVQKLLSQAQNPTLCNVETVLEGFGLAFHVVADRAVSIKPALRQARDRKKAAS